MDKDNLRFTVTYSDGSDGGLMTTETFRMINLKKGKRPEWIEQIIDQIIKDGYYTGPFGTKYELQIRHDGI